MSEDMDDLEEEPGEEPEEETEEDPKEEPVEGFEDGVQEKDPETVHLEIWYSTLSHFLCQNQYSISVFQRTTRE